MESLSVTANHILNRNSSELALFDLKTKDILQVGATLNFTLDMKSGDVEYYLVRLNDEILKNSTSRWFNVTFPEVYLIIQFNKS